MSSLSDNLHPKKKVAVVTGANRGIGLQVVQNLCQQLDASTFDVLLTSRNEQNGKEAVNKIASAVSAPAAAPKFHELDIDSTESIERLRDVLVKTYGGLDILVQNAAVYVRNTEASFAVIAEQTLKTNYWAVRDVCRLLLPIMRENGSLVLVASRMGSISFVKDEKTRKRLVSNGMQLNELDELMRSYTDEAKRREHQPGPHEHELIWEERAFGSPYGPYCASKLGVIALARVLQREVEASSSGINSHVFITSCSPGYVATGMTEFKGERTVAEGADTPTYLALLPTQRPEKGDVLSALKGLFIHDRQVLDWENYKPDKR